MTVALYDALAWVLALALCVPGLGGRAGRAVIAMAVIALALHLPIGGTSLLALLRGAVGSPSVTTVLVLAALLFARVSGRDVFAPGERLTIAALAGVTAILFYPPALGLGALDPYAWGYVGSGLAAGVALAALLAGAAGRWVLAAGLTLALAGWRLHLLESPNLWDYVVDPMLGVAGLVALIVLPLRRRRGRSGAF